MTALTLADRLRHVEESTTLALSARAKALRKAGQAVVDFAAGEPDFPTPAHVKQAAVEAIHANQTRYTPVAGLPELRDAIAQSLNRSRQTAYDASDVVVSCGAKHALFNGLQVLCQAGDEVIVFAPYWVSYPPLVHLTGARPVIVATEERTGFLPEPKALREALTDATKLVILNSPSNPTGAVIDEERLTAIAQIARERGLIVVSDEIYDELVYPPARHASIVQLAPELAGQTLIVGGVSKTYSMTGWRIGYVAGPRPWIEEMSKLQSHSTSNPTSISQHAALAALRGDQQVVREMREAFRARRDRIVQGLNAIPGLRCAVPGGAFYAWCRVEGLGQPAATTAAQWLEEALVATVPGEGFGAPGYVRVSYATSDEAVAEGLARLGKWVAGRGPRE